MFKALLHFGMAWHMLFSCESYLSYSRAYYLW